MNRVAIIGAGIGADHLVGFRENADQFEVSTICDLDLKRAGQMLQEGEYIALTSDLKSVLADPKIDIVDICLPPHLHYPIAKQVLEAGKHAICEKPLVCSLEETDSLIAISKKTGKKIFPVFQYRYGRAASQMQALIDAGLTGKPLVATLETHWNRQEDYYAIDWRGTWKGERGGAVLGHAIHNHDLLCHFMGSVTSLNAMLDTRVNDIETEDCAAISMRMDNGALATSSVTLGSCEEEISRLRFIYSDLTVESDGNPYRPAAGTWRFMARNPENQNRIDDVVASIGEVKTSYSGFFEAIAKALNSQGVSGGTEKFTVSLADGRRSIELVTAIYQSARSGQTVSLPLEESSSFYKDWTP